MKKEKYTEEIKNLISTIFLGCGIIALSIIIIAILISLLSY